MDAEAKMTKLRAIVASGQHARVDGVRVDLFSASVIVKVHDALNEVNRAKFSALPVATMASVAFKLAR